MSIARQSAGGYGDGAVPALAACLPALPVPGNLALLVVATGSSTAPFAVQDCYGTVYTLVAQETSTSPHVFIYIGTIPADPLPSVIFPLVSQAFISTTAAYLTAIYFGEIPAGLVAGASTSYDSGTGETGTGTTATAGTVTWTGGVSGLVIAAFGASAAGTVSAPGSGYTVLYNLPYDNGRNWGLTVVAQTGDTSGSATPSVTYTASTTWTAASAVITAQNVVIAASTPYGLQTATGTVPVPPSSTTAITLSAVGTQWNDSTTFSASGSASVTYTIDSETSAIVNFTAPATLGSYTITDESTGKAIPVIVSNFCCVNSATGSDSNSYPGTQSAPLLTPAHAAASASANDVILCEGTFTISSAISSTIYLFWGQYGSGATLNGGSNTAVLASSNCGMTVCDLTATLDTVTSGSASGGGIIQAELTDAATHNDGVYFSNLTLSGGAGAAILVAADEASTSTWNHIKAIGNNVTASPLGIQVLGYSTSVTSTNTQNISDMWLLDNSFADMPGLTGASNPQCFGIWTRCTGPTAGPCVIAGNRYTNLGSGISETNGSVIGGWFTRANGTYYLANVADGIYTGATDTVNIDGHDCDTCSVNCIGWGNTSANCDGAGFDRFAGNGGGNNHICFNVLVENGSKIPTTGYGGLLTDNTVGDDSYANYWYNNTVVQSAADGAPALGFTDGNGALNQVLNNVLVCPLTCPVVYFSSTPASTYAANGNLYNSGTGHVWFAADGDNYTSLAAFQAVEPAGQDADSIAGVTPRFAGPLPVPSFTPSTIASLSKAYALVSGSPGAGAAINLTTLGGFPPPMMMDITGAAVNWSDCSMGAVTAAVSAPNAFDAAILADNPVWFFKFNEAAGSATVGDTMFSQAPATVTSATLGASGIISTLTDTCVEFNGTDGWINLTQTASVENTSSAAISSTTGVSALANFNASSLSSSVANLLVGCKTGSTPSSGTYTVDLSVVSGQIQLKVSDTTNTITYTGTTTPINTGTFYSVVGTYFYNSGDPQYSITINGVVQTITVTGTAPTGSIPITSLYAGSTFGTTFPWAGKLARAAVFATPLSAARAAAYYAAAAPSSSGAPARKWFPGLSRRRFR